MSEQAEKIAEDKKGGVQSALEDLKKAIEADDMDGMKAAMEQVNKEMQTLSAELYAQAKAEAPPAGEGPSEESTGTDEANASSDDDVIDADFEMVDDDKK